MPKIVPLHTLYAQIPATTGCTPGCGRCCGPVPVTPGEAAALRLPEGATLTPTDANLTCSFLRPDGCSVYEQRPFMCRLYATSRHPMLTCPKGCKPVKERLSLKDTRRLSDAYRRLMPRPH